MLNHTPLILAVLALGLGTACGGEETDPDDLRCSEEERADEYLAGMSKDGVNQLFQFRLVESTPAPPEKGDNTWIVDVLDFQDSTPVDSADITVMPFMPDHGHGSPIAAEIAPTGDPGQFQVDRVNLWMPGLWEVTIAADDGTEQDETIFSFCIEG
jgi:hypothetical protein